MSRLQKIKLLNKVSTIKKNLALKLYKEAQDSLLKETKKLSDLEGFEKEYIKSFCENKKNSSFLLENSHKFLDRLKDIIVKQKDNKHVFEKMLKNRQELIIKTKNYDTALNNYLEILQKEEESVSNKIEQKELDNLVSDVYSQKASQNRSK